MADRPASSEPRPEVRDCPLMHGAAPCPMCAYCPHGLTAGRGADERCLECGAAVTEPRPENPYQDDTACFCPDDWRQPYDKARCPKHGGAAYESERSKHWREGSASRQPEIDRERERVAHLSDVLLKAAAVSSTVRHAEQVVLAMGEQFPSLRAEIDRLEAERDRVVKAKLCDCDDPDGCIVVECCGGTPCACRFDDDGKLVGECLHHKTTRVERDAAITAGPE